MAADTRTEMTESAALAVARGGLREAVETLERTTTGGLNKARIRAALQVIEHVAELLRPHAD